jgi:Kinesin motor domain
MADHVLDPNKVDDADDAIDENEEDPLDVSIIVDDSALAQVTHTPDVWFRSGDKRNLQEVFGRIADDDNDDNNDDDAAGETSNANPHSDQPPATKKRAAPAMRVVVRIRPTAEPIKTVTIVPHSHKIRTHNKEYEFSAILSPEITQAQTYESIIRPYLPGLLSLDDKEGQSALVFCYGRTNAGKTYTVMGNFLHHDNDDHTEWGLVPRVLHELLAHGSQSLGLACFEVYNEVIFDLLPTGGGTSIKEHLLRNVSEHHVTSTTQWQTLLGKCIKARSTADNQINSQSSRSHAVMRIAIPPNHHHPNNNQQKQSPPTYLWIVDLAGSEKAKQARLFTEAVKINTSLNVLNRCFLALREGKTPPYRDSKLTHILGNHWKSNHAARTTMLVNIGDNGQPETVLHYASVAAKAVIALPVNNTNVDQQQQQQQKPPKAQYDINGRVKRTITNVMRKLSPKRKPPGFATSNTIAVAAAANKQQQQHQPTTTTTTEQLPPQPFDYEERLEELQEVIRECEDEMARMRNAHLQVLDDVTATAQDDVVRQVDALQQRYEHINTEKDAQITFLQQALDQLQVDYHQSQQQLQEQQDQLQVDNTTTMEAMETEHQEVLTEKDNMIDLLREQVQRLEEQLLLLQQPPQQARPALSSCSSGGTATIADQRQDAAPMTSQEDVVVAEEHEEDDNNNNNNGQGETEEKVAAESESFVVAELPNDEELLAARPEKSNSSKADAAAANAVYADALKSTRKVKEEAEPMPMVAKRTGTGSEGVHHIPSPSSSQEDVTTVFGEEPKPRPLLKPLNSNNNNTIKPPGRLRLDPATGTYRRPRGKAPRGSSHWDERNGVWQMAA